MSLCVCLVNQRLNMHTSIKLINLFYYVGMYYFSIINFKMKYYAIIVHFNNIYCYIIFEYLSLIIINFSNQLKTKKVFYKFFILVITFNARIM